MKVYYSPAHEGHRPWFKHPEAPDRLEAVLRGAREAGAEVAEPPAREDVWSLVELAHERRYVEAVRRACSRAPVELDGDTYISGGTCDAAALAVSAAVHAAERRETALVAARPPGHHAGFAGRALSAPTQGFCIFNNAAIAALHVGEGVAVVDVDVHHGNGTQEILYERDILYVSLHQHPATLYPGTGYPEEVGAGRGEGYNLNVPLPPWTGDDGYARALDEVVMPVLRQYGPRLILVSLGWDAHREDPLANLALSVGGYLAAVRRLASLQVPLVFLLEGGYNREVLRAGTRALVRLLKEGVEEPGEPPTSTEPRVMERVGQYLEEVRRAHSRHWRFA